MANPLIAEKVADVIRKLDQDFSTSINGITKRNFLRGTDTVAWIKKRKNAGISSICDTNDVDLAKELFRAWDIRMSKFLTLDDIIEKLVSIGLSVD